MNPPDVTDDKNEWELVPRRTDLWMNLVHENVYSTDGGKTYTISTEREDPNTPRQVRNSRRV